MEEIQSILLDYKQKGNIGITWITQGGLGTYPNDNNRPAPPVKPYNKGGEARN